MNLTGIPRKVKDIAADLHNMTLKWDTLNTKGMDIITRISNILIEKVFSGCDEHSQDDLAVRMLPQELNSHCDLLTDVVESMTAIETKMHRKVEMAEGLIVVQKLDKSQSENSILFSTMTMADITSIVKEIHENFQQEVKFKQELCKHVAFAEDRDTAMFYSTCWMHQPYIQTSCLDQLQALLIETGHVL